jgi:membrane peptidoglycan carboxypeptidase
MNFIRKIILVAFCIFFIVCTYLLVNGYSLYKSVLKETPLEEKINEIRNKEDYTKIEDVSPDFLNAIVAVEDHRFYKHNGVDLISTVKAIFTNVKASSYVTGGSSITQQLAKNMYFSQEKKMVRKIAEMFMAYNLEKNLSKNEILELYINNIYYGSGYYSVYSASMGYFNKKPSELTLDEASLLAGIPNAPSIYSLDVNPTLARQRQKQVISAMKEYNYIND